MTAHPEMRPFLTAEWRHLLMLNYAADASVLRQYVPSGTELDSWNGTTYVSVVGFLFLHTRVLGVPIPFHRSFTEVNLRFYVRRQSPHGWRRGVVFVREIVPRRAIAAIARLCYSEPYMALPMSHRAETLDGKLVAGGVLEYSWLHAGRWNSVAGTVASEARPLAEGTEAEFITEHYWGYTARGWGGTSEYQVEHPSWAVSAVIDPVLDCDAGPLYGSEFAEILSVPPVSAFIAEGSRITVGAGVRLEYDVAPISTRRSS